MTRLEANLLILKRIETYLKKYPDLRFCQALFDLDLDREDNFHQEPERTLANITNKLEKDADR